MARILKTLAFAAGAGVAFGICTTAGGRRGSRNRRISQVDVVEVEPLLDRLEQLERKFGESAAAPNSSSAYAEELTSRIAAQDAEIERLRALVDTRAVEIQGRLEAEMMERHQASFASLESSIEIKMSDRIAALEKSLGDHGSSIDVLRSHAHDTDNNLKRLIAAIEKLVQRSQTSVAEFPATAFPPATIPFNHSVGDPSPATNHAPGPIPVPFEAHMAEARAKVESVSVVRASKVYKEDDEDEVEVEVEPKKSRFPLARIFGMIALIVLSGALR